MGDEEPNKKFPQAAKKARSTREGSAKYKVKQEHLNSLLKDGLKKPHGAEPFLEGVETKVLNMQTVWQSQKKKSPMEINITPLIKNKHAY